MPLQMLVQTDLGAQPLTGTSSAKPGSAKYSSSMSGMLMRCLFSRSSLRSKNVVVVGCACAGERRKKGGGANGCTLNSVVEQVC